MSCRSSSPTRATEPPSGSSACAPTADVTPRRAPVSHHGEGQTPTKGDHHEHRRELPCEGRPAKVGRLLEIHDQAVADALRDVAAILEREILTGDRVYRYGGEELLLLLADEDAHTGAAVAERHRANVQRAALRHPLNPPTGVITFSAGVAAAQPGETPTQVLRRADEALYQAKSSGSNQIAVAISQARQPALADTTHGS